MPTDELDDIFKIETKICELQSSYVSMQSQIKKSQNLFERQIDEAALHIIDILDMIECTLAAKSKSEMGDVAHPAPNLSSHPIIIKKIEKRLSDILGRWQIHEIIFKDGRIETGKVRVLETQKFSSEKPIGTILQICRKGYQRGSKIIRPADVITCA